jgi:hypothetical protein
MHRGGPHPPPPPARSGGEDRPLRSAAGPVLIWATVWFQLKIGKESDPRCIHKLCIHVHMAVYLHACGLYPHSEFADAPSVWLCINMQVAVFPCTVHVALYLHAHCHVPTWSCIHVHVGVYPHAEFGFALWTIACAGFRYALWATAQIFVKHYEPEQRIL